MEDNQAKNEIRSFIARYVRGVEVKDGDDIFLMGLVNSMFALQLVEFTEKAFEIKVAPEDLDIANFRSINAICALVDRKRGEVVSTGVGGQ